MAKVKKKKNMFFNIRKKKKTDRVGLSFSNMDDKRTLITDPDDIDTWRKPNQSLVDVFMDTREVSKTKYAKETEAAKKDAKVIDIEDEDVLMNMAKKQKVVFRTTGTVSAGYSAVKSSDKYDKVGILNFADALIPAGLVLYGAPTQEENICRCSNLYETLIECPLYYNMNRLIGTLEYLDIMIYSPNITVFKDDTEYKQVDPVKMDVITCPAPSCKMSDAKTEAVFKRRIRKVLIAAQKHGVNKIVLGAWGCGAFGQDPSIVGKCFASVLKEVKAFDEVIFAIRSSQGMNEHSNYTLFKAAFDAEYKAKGR